MKERFINWLIKFLKVDTNQINDGYHSFGNLYEHRIELFIALCREYGDNLYNERTVWKSKKHSDGSSIEGWFILGIGTKKGNQITYHIPLSYWEKLYDITTLSQAPKFDGHNSRDVIKRLKKL